MSLLFLLLLLLSFFGFEDVGVGVDGVWYKRFFFRLFFGVGVSVGGVGGGGGVGDVGVGSVGSGYGGSGCSVGGGSDGFGGVGVGGVVIVRSGVCFGQVPLYHTAPHLCRN